MSDILESNTITSFKKKVSLVFNFALINIQLRYKNSYLGIVWSALEPLLYFTVLYVVFTGIRGSQEDFAIYLISGIMIFHIFTRGTSGGLACLTSHSGIIKSLRIKKDFFPIVTVVATAILAFVDIGVFFALMPVFHFTPSITLILLPIPMILLFVLVLGLSYLLSIVNVYIRDIQVIWPIFTHTLLFVSPIFWKTHEVQGVLLNLQMINPVGQIIELVHEIVISGTIPALSSWLYTTLFVIGIFAFGYIVFRRLEERVVEEF